MTALAETSNYPPPLRGEGLEIRPWDELLVAQMARWGQHGFPYHAFDLAYLADRRRASAKLSLMREAGRHLHFVACEAGMAVGRASVNLDDPEGLYLWSVHVPPEHEGRGVCRRMLAVIMSWLEGEHPGRGFVLTSNAFASHAHRAYAALGFSLADTRWHFDRELALELWRVPAAQRESVAQHIRFSNGRWEVRSLMFRRRPGAAMETGRPGRRRPATGSQR